MTPNSLTENEEHDILSQILKTILDCMPQLFFRPQCVVSGTYYVSLIPNSRGRLAELIVYIIPQE